MKRITGWEEVIYRAGLGIGWRLYQTSWKIKSVEKKKYKDYKEWYYCQENNVNKIALFVKYWTQVQNNIKCKQTLIEKANYFNVHVTWVNASH